MIRENFRREVVFELDLEKPVGFQDEDTERKGISVEGSGWAKDVEIKFKGEHPRRGRVQWVSCQGQREITLSAGHRAVNTDIQG